jgi:group I intron endonuclease
MGFVYGLEFPNDKMYVGCTTKSLDERLDQHAQTASLGYGYAVHRAIRKFGVENVRVKVFVESNDSEELFAIEAELIRDLETMKPYGYNLTAGGDGIAGYVPTEEDKRKMREGLRRYNSSEIGKQRRSAASTASLSRPEVRARLAASVSETVRNKYANGFVSPSKGKSMPMAAENGRNSAAKQSATVTGRKRAYREDGSWYWAYPNRESSAA